jgi:cell wall-associated NlpC family hydrolase
MTTVHKAHHPTASHAAHAPSKLELGSSGASVKQLQLELKQAGLYSGPIDGHFGSQTDASLKKFQRQHGLKADGWAGPQTLAKLKGHSTGSSTHSSFTPSKTSAKPTTGAGPAVQASGPRTGQINSMLQWSKSKVGTPYAAVNPFRFGSVPWDGKAHTSVNGTGTVYHFPKGTQVFDCSGFVVASYRKLGVDLAAHGLATSGAINANSNHFLQNVPTSQLQPGDLITLKPENGVGHVVIYEGNGRIVQCSGGKGVNEAPLDWSRVQSARRVPLP